MILLVHCFSKRRFKSKLYRKSIIKLFQLPYDEVYLDDIDNIQSDKINSYQFIYIFAIKIDNSIPIQLQNLRRNYTGKIIGLFPFFEGINNTDGESKSETLCNGIISCFDLIITCFYRYITLLKKFSNYSYIRYLPSPLSLIKNQQRPNNKQEVRIGIILDSMENHVLNKLIKSIDTLVSEGYTLVGLNLSEENSNNLEILQSIQKECPTFMIYTKGKHTKNPINEIRKCTCILTNQYESFWLAMCYNIPIIPLIVNTSLLSLSFEVGFDDLSINAISSFSSKEIFKKITSCLKKVNSYTRLQERYLIKSRLILGSIPKLNLITHFNNSKKKVDDITLDISLDTFELPLPQRSYFINPSNGIDLRWKIISNYLSYFNRNDGVYIDSDMFESLRENVYLFEWLGVLIESPKNLIENKNFIASLNMCRGLFTFSNKIRNILNKQITESGLGSIFKIPIIELVYPVLETLSIWDPKNFKNLNITVISDLSLEHKLDIKCKYTQHINNENDDDNSILIFMFSDISIPLNNGYLSRCICREVPVILPKEESYYKILGSDYPLYWNDLSEISSLCKEDKIVSAIDYLGKFSKEIFSLNYFIKSIHTSKCLN